MLVSVILLGLVPAGDSPALLIVSDSDTWPLLPASEILRGVLLSSSPAPRIIILASFTSSNLNVANMAIKRNFSVILSAFFFALLHDFYKFVFSQNNFRFYPRSRHSISKFYFLAIF